MALFEWSEDYSVKIPSIDAQHKHLVELLNELHVGMLNGTSSERLGPLLDRLVEYTAYHFSHEEGLFTETGYPLGDAHAAVHDRLIDQVLDFKRRYDAGESTLGMHLMVFLKDWLIAHILGCDMEYVGHLSARQVQ